MIGKIISHYRITEKLGLGGMGVVYKAFDTKLERDVALKLLRPEAMGDPAAKERFIREARAASALNHPNITTIYEIDEWHGQDFICMEYVEGETVKKKIQSGQMSMDDVLNIATQTAEALQEAHEHDVIHRDIKSENIMVTPKGQVKVMDFGLAKLKGVGGLTKNGTTMGTISYMSPEQARGEDVDHRTDIWSFGVVLYEMITGQLPFRGEYEQAVIYSIMNEEPKPFREIRTDASDEFEEITKKAMVKDLGDRYQSISEMKIDLERFQKEKESFVETRSSRHKEEKSKTKRLKIISMSVGFLFLIILGYFLLKPYYADQILVREPIPIAVISFENHTGDKSYDHLQKVIPNLLITKLEQSEYLQVTTWERMYDLLKQLGKEDVEIIDKDLAFEVCRLDGIDAVVLGSYAKLGNMFATEVKLLDVETKRSIRSASSRGEGEDSILRQIDELGKEISKGIGLSERKNAQDQQPLRDVTTSSMEAYNYFIRGREEHRKRYYKEARWFLEKAVELDSTFAIAHLWLAWANGYLENYKLQKEQYEKARKYSAKATEKERLYIEAFYARLIEGNPEKWFNLLKQIIKKYPKEKGVYDDLGAWYRNKGQYTQAIEYFDKALELDPQFGSVLNRVAYCYAGLGNFEKAIEYLKRYASVSPGDANPFDSMGDIYFKMGQTEEAISKYEEALTVKPDFQSSPKLAVLLALKEEYHDAMKWIVHYIATAPSDYIKAEAYLYEAIYLYWLGRVDSCFNTVQKLKVFAEPHEIALWFYAADWLKSWIYYDVGELELGKQNYESWNNFWMMERPQNVTSHQLNWNFYHGLIHLKAGDIDSAKSKLLKTKSLYESLKNEKNIENSAGLHYDIFHGEVLLAEGRADEAIFVCKNPSYYKIPDLGIQIVTGNNVPFLKDVRARAFLKKRELDSAIAEYERLIDVDLNIKLRRLINPKYHYRLAKLYEQKGSVNKAIKEYEKFLDLWKDADEDLPEKIDAKARLANLTESK